MTRFFKLAAVSIAAALLNAAGAAALDSEVKIETSVSTEQVTSTMPVKRDPILLQASINANEVLVCTTKGCYAVLADLIDVSKVFVATATNGQNVLVPYLNHMEAGQETGALNPEN